MADCNYVVPDKDASGDNFYGSSICSQALINYFWNTYGFSDNQDWWDDGFGWEAPCNTNMPLARTFNGCYVLSYSAADYSNDSYASGSILNWARRYVRENIEDVRSLCGDDPAVNARSFSGIFVDDRVELYLGFFYRHDVVDRAGTLLHESRHQGGKEHDRETEGGFQMDSTWEYNGAWAYNASYLGWFYHKGQRTTSALRERARQRANLIIDRCFETHPGFSF